MKPTVLTLALATAVTATPVLAASECGQQIQAIERRMQSAGGSEVSGKPMNPNAKAQASNEAGRAPAPANAAQAPSKQKMADAQSLIDKAKKQDATGDKDGCESTMMVAQKTIGALP